MVYSQTSRLFMACCWMKSATDHIPTTRNFLQTTYQTHHLPYRPHTDRLHLPTTYLPHADHVPTTYRPRTDRIHMYHRPHTDCLYRPHADRSTCSLLPSLFSVHPSVRGAQTRPGGAACDRWGSCHPASFGQESPETLLGVPVVDCERVRRVTVCNSKIQRNAVAIVPREKNSKEMQLPCPEKQPTCAFWARTPGKPYSSERNERGNWTELMEWFVLSELATISSPHATLPKTTQLGCILLWELA